MYITMAPKYKKSDVGNADKPKRSHKVLDLIKKDKKGGGKGDRDEEYM